MEIHNDIFDYYPPQEKFIGLVSIPHSGEILPEEFKEFLIDEFNHLAQDVDYRVHELIDINALQKAGIGVLKAHIIRTAIDLNRSKNTALLNWKSNSKGIQIVQKDPLQNVAHKLVEKFYSPYYEFLKTLIYELGKGQAVPSIVDLHSMPSRAEEYHMRQNPNQQRVRPDFCLSDYKGVSCQKSYIDCFINHLKEDFKDVRYNDPYIGGYITQYIHEQFPDGNNIQIEISRELYMDEETKELKSEGVNFLRRNLTKSLLNGFRDFSD